MSDPMEQNPEECPECGAPVTIERHKAHVHHTYAPVASLDAEDLRSIKLALSSIPTWFPETAAKIDALIAVRRAVSDTVTAPTATQPEPPRTD